MWKRKQDNRDNTIHGVYQLILLKFEAWEPVQISMMALIIRNYYFWWLWVLLPALNEYPILSFTLFLNAGDSHDWLKADLH